MLDPNTAAHAAWVRHGQLLLLTQCAARLSPRSSHFRWPSSALLLDVQEWIVAELLGIGASSIARDKAYEKSFLKELLARLEEAASGSDAGEEEREIIPELPERYAELMTMPSTSGESPSGPIDHMSSTLPLQAHTVPTEKIVEHWFPVSASDSEKVWRSIRMRENSSALIAGGSTACKTWEASLRLASWLLHPVQRDTLVHPRARVLELGSGTGLVSALVTMLQRQDPALADGATHRQPVIFATDLPDVVTTKLQSLIHHNRSSLSEASNLRLYDLDWIGCQDRIKEQSGPVQPLDHMAPTLILGADIVFDPDICPALVSVIKYALQTGARSNAQVAPQAVISSTVRNASTYSRFLALLDGAGLQTEEIDLDRFKSSAPAGTEEHPILPFPSTHDDSVGGVVKGVRISLR